MHLPQDLDYLHSNKHESNLAARSPCVYTLLSQFLVFYYEVMFEWHGAGCHSHVLRSPLISSSNNSNDCCSTRPTICVIVRCQTQLWRKLCYQQECTNTNTFAWVIDLYLPTFLTAFPRYWQYKHMGRRITFHSQSTFSPRLSSPQSVVLSLSAALAICLNKNGADNGTAHFCHFSFTPNFMG